jgi:RimJ/RimL family protein N-acetyltransferase
MKKFDKSRTVVGKSVVLRAATPEDAQFVFEMRSNSEATIFLNRVQGTVGDQETWLRESYADPYQIYFVICSTTGERVGLVRLYDQRGDSFCWGSWLISPTAPSTTAIESALLVYRYALDVVGFQRSHFDVRTGNSRVIAFHKRFGAVEVGRDDQNVFFEIDAPVIRRSIRKFHKYLPQGT